MFLLWFPLSVILLSASLLTKHFSLSRSHVVQESFVTSCCLQELSRSGECPYTFGLCGSFIFYPLARFPLMIAFLRRFGLDISDPIRSQSTPYYGNLLLHQFEFKLHLSEKPVHLVKNQKTSLLPSFSTFAGFQF